MTLECVHNNNIAVFVVIVVGPMAGPEPAGSGRAWASNMTIVLRAGPGRAWTYFLRAGPGLIIQFAGRARARAGSAQLLRARAGPRNFFSYQCSGHGPLSTA